MSNTTKLLILLFTASIISGCGHFKKIDTEAYTGNYGYQVSGQIKRLDPKTNSFTVAINLEQVRYEGQVNIYSSKGDLPLDWHGWGSPSYDINPDMTRKSHPVSLYDHIDRLSISVFRKSNGNSPVRYTKTLISDNLIKIKINEQLTGYQTAPLYIKVESSLDSKISKIKRESGARSYWSKDIVYDNLKNSVELCVTCSYQG